MSRMLKFVLMGNLLVIAVLTFAYPHLMVAPGKLIPGHKQLERDCFACHSPLTGANSVRCATCHLPADIGRLTTKGKPILKKLTSGTFHQQLISQDCVECHSDHAGVKRLHTQGNFNHSLLKKEMRDQCQSCHQLPNDALHLNITGNCISCHAQDKWTPATFDHNKYFVLDQDHNTGCATCHVKNNYSRYTCYNCHEHTPANIRRKHIEEGVRQFDNCVECHRSADEDDIKSADGRGEKDRERD